MVANQEFLPEAFHCEDYLRRVADLDVVGGALVSGSFQAFDCNYLVSALDTLGPTFVGVAQLPISTSREKLLELDVAGVRAVRFNLRRGMGVSLLDLERFAAHVFEIAGWHVELYVDHTQLSDLFTVIRDLPLVSIDHVGLSRSSLPLLLELVDRGVFVKLTGFGRLDFDPRLAIRELASVNPAALLFGTDLPSTRVERKFEDADLHLVCAELAPPDVEKVLFTNAVSLYRPRSLA